MRPAILSTIFFVSFISLALNSPLNNQYLLTKENLRLISTKQNHAEWLNEIQILKLIQKGIKFIDVTDFVEYNSPLNTAELPAKLNQDSTVQELIKKIDKLYMKKFLTTFTSFNTRYYRSKSGRESQQWLLEQLNLLKDKNKNEKVLLSVTEFEHTWGQNSIIFQIKPIENDDGVVIIGAHQDSVNQWNPWFGRAPGADDDGSGSATIIEALRVILHGGYTPKKVLEFHWYSGEEGGMLGSQKVAAKYRKDNVAVVGMLQVDMTGYVKSTKKEIIGISTDYMDPKLTNFLQAVSKRYCLIPWGDMKCGYACSDHVSWYNLGYPAAFTTESEMKDSSPYIHTTGDTVDTLNFNHMKEFVKLVL
ncbi:Leucine aminopeptidase 1, partial [Clydaea vesicula]